MTALVKLPNISPTIKIDMVSLIRCETDSTSIKTSELPTHEASTIPYEERKMPLKNGGTNPAPKIIKATPKLAPELSPKTSGPAKGFRNKVCISKPLADKPMPAKMAINAFGKR